MSKPANDEMVQGFRDGYDRDAPEPNANRSHSYRHGFLAARNDHSANPLCADEMRRLADEAMQRDAVA